MRLVTFDEAASRLRGKRIAVVGSAPSVLDNKPGFIDGHDVVVRVNNYKLSEATGRRTDVFYSFFGGSIRKTADELRADGVSLCWAKCPDAKALSCDWHERNGKQAGVDFRYIYQMRQSWWFCDVFVPTSERFMKKFDLLGRHIPSTGFAALLDVLDCAPASVYVTGFDFFSSGLHNVNEKWKPGDSNDPIKHEPLREAAWLAKHERDHTLVLDATLTALLEQYRKARAA